MLILLLLVTENSPTAQLTRKCCLVADAVLITQLVKYIQRNRS